MNDPRVSVVMSVYNGERFLRPAIESILGQTFHDFEFIIVDDGSSDASREIIRSYDDPRIRIVQNSVNLGLTRSLNIGLRHSRAPLVARQDADDVSYPSRLERQVAFLGAHENVALLGTQARMIDQWGRPLRSAEYRKATQEDSIRWQMAIDSAFVHTSVIFRHSVVLGEFGGYDETFTNGQDADLWSRIATTHALRNLPEPLVGARVHAESISSNREFLRTPETIRRGETVFLRNLRRVVPAEVVPDQWIPLYVRIYVGGNLDHDEMENLLRGLKAIARQFLLAPHDAVVAAEFRVVLAAKFMLLAAYCGRSQALFGIRAVANAFRYQPSVAAAQLQRYSLRLAAQLSGLQRHVRKHQ